jgi:hypothetical protein
MEIVKKYILVGWPDIQDFMMHPRWNECIFCDSIPGHEVGDSTYAVPEDLFNEMCAINVDIENLSLKNK